MIVANPSLRAVAAQLTGAKVAPEIEAAVREAKRLEVPRHSFHPRARERYDAALCGYHDQALVPIKTLFFDDGVNITLGLPVVRTSPDHGTAFGIAGQDRAVPGAMIAAIAMAGAAATRRATARA